MHAIFVSFCFDSCRNIIVNWRCPAIIISEIIWKYQKSCWLSHITKAVCSRNYCLGWARAVFLWLNYQVEHLCWVHDAYAHPADSQWSLLKLASQAQSVPWFLSFSLMNLRFGHDDDLWGKEYKRRVNYLSLRLSGGPQKAARMTFLSQLLSIRMVLWVHSKNGSKAHTW